MRAGGARSRGRAAAVTAMLAAFIAAIIIVFCTMVGFIGYWLVEAGAVRLDDLTSTGTVLSFILIGSAALAVVLAVCLYRTMGEPLRQMAEAVGQLARGNFDVRMRERGAWHLREVDEFARSFNRAAEELSGTEMMRAGFISDFSHEFRTPINTLSGFAQLLREGDLSPEERDEYLQIIADESVRLSGLSERILLLSKMEAATILPDAREIEVAESVRRAAAIVEPKAREKGVELALSLDERRIVGNGDYLVQLWMNLLDNAVKFSPAGTCVSVALYGGRACSEGGASAGEEGVTCWVSDEGPGMDERTRAHLFDRFYQGDTSHSREGNGLGLSVARRIVELHGGTIEVASIPNKGTSFEVRLPARQ
ncbi:HAMP domain-containing sensor histidine kinase [uncultured Adlercreutzia sp.]|uniref:HAMP domain-containing sensor histidine kinase n=1 Tax=uncultured Adlercreutzia sp. TaxID=875803 RepID=UPI0026F3C4A2|nr:HAMP domain-containing sensor histidine kinase [uncultured Adlercreutzia sp.]